MLAPLRSGRNRLHDKKTDRASFDRGAMDCATRKTFRVRLNTDRQNQSTMASHESGSGSGSGSGSRSSSREICCVGDGSSFDCDVCAERVKGAPLACAHCAFSSCRECAKRYWADRPFDPPACMSCRKVMSSSNLETCFSKTSVKTGLENSRRHALFEAEKGLFLLTQEVLFPVLHVYEAQLVEMEERRLNLQRLEQNRFDHQLLATDLQRTYVRLGSKGCSAFRDWANARAQIASLDADVETAWTAVRGAADSAKQLYRSLTQHSLDETTAAFHRQLRHSTCQHLPPGVVERVLGAAGAGDGGAAAATTAQVGAAAGPPDPAAVAAAAAAAAEPKAPKRLAPCVRAGCMGFYSSENGTCMVCTTEHCVKCAKMLSGEVPDAPETVAEPEKEDEKNAGMFSIAGAAFSVTAT